MGKTQTRKNCLQTRNFLQTHFILLSLLLLEVSSISILFLVSYPIDNIYGEKEEDAEVDTSSNKDIKFQEYTNSKAGYKISYPSDVIIENSSDVVRDVDPSDVITDEDNSGSLDSFDTFRDKYGVWSFAVIVQSDYGGILDLEQKATQFLEDYKDHSEPFGDKITEMKSLKVAGQPAFMFQSISESNMVKETYVYMIANKILYYFEINADIDKFDQYADLFSTMLKSFELIDQKSDN